MLKVYKRVSSHHSNTQGSLFIANRFSILGKTLCLKLLQLICVLQMVKKRGGPPLRKELDNILYLQSHPEIYQYFADVGCITYVERLQEGYHQGIAEVFAKSYDGKKATVGSLEIEVDEATIASATGMPRSGHNWFKTTVKKNLDFIHT